MAHMDSDRANRPCDSGRKTQLRRIDISPDRPDRCNDSKLVGDALGPNVTGVENLVDTLQQWRKLRVKISMCVRNDANPHRSQESGSVEPISRSEALWLSFGDKP